VLPDPAEGSCGSDGGWGSGFEEGGCVGGCNELDPEPEPDVDPDPDPDCDIVVDIDPVDEELAASLYMAWIVVAPCIEMLLVALEVPSFQWSNT